MVRAGAIIFQLITWNIKSICCTDPDSSVPSQRLVIRATMSGASKFVESIYD